MDSSPSQCSAALAGRKTANKPKPVGLSHHFSETTKRRVPNKMKQYYKYFAIPGIGNLAGGMPNVSLFPFDTLEAQAARPDRWTPSPNHPPPKDADALAGKLAAAARVSSSPSDPTAVASHITVPKTLDESDPLKKIDLSTALQYGQANGYPPLQSWIKQFATRHLNPNIPYEGGADVILTCGSTDGMSKTLELFVNPWTEGYDHIEDRPGILCETFVYSSILNQALPRGMQVVPVTADAGGMCPKGPGGLEDVLSSWDPEKGKRPHLMYTVTMGHNPTGVVLSVERRKEIYALCSKYDVIIIEDDPYWYLQFPSADAEEAKSRDLPVPEPRPVYRGEKSSGYEFLDMMTPSFLNFDTDGRVVRLDTFSKTCAPGCRLGWITAQPALVEKYFRITESSTQQPSGFVQSMVAELAMGPQPEATKASFLSLRTARDRAAFTGWQMDGWVRWLAGLRGVYERRMTRMCRILDAGRFQLKQGTPARAADADWGVITKTALYSYDWPRGGMFVWVRMNFESHPLFGAPRSAGDGSVVDGIVLSSAAMIFLTTAPYRVAVSPGLMFSATDEILASVGWQYFRICFAAEAEENIDSCSQRFVDGVQKFWKIKKVEQIEELLDDIPVAVALTASSEDEESMGGFGPWFGC